MSYCVETHNLSKRFSAIKGYRDLILHPFRKKEIPALSNVNLKIKKGELFGLLGPNGAGKTTLIKILSTLILPTSGRASVGGYDVSKDGKKVRRIIGYIVSEERSFYWRLTGRQNLKFFAKLNNIENSDAELRIERLIDFMDLKQVADRMFKDYSTGMRQKLAIARGLITNPDIIFMDEPTRSLDPSTSQDLRRLIRDKFVKENNKTVIFATHNLNEVEEMCDRIAIIDHGEIIAMNTIDELKNRLKLHKSFVIKLKNQNNNLLQRIHAIPMVRNVEVLTNGSISDVLQIELETKDERESISNVIKEIIEMGGDINTFYEKDVSLESLYTKLISTRTM